MNSLTEHVQSRLTEIHASKRGKQTRPPLMMFKALLLQCWYMLRDPALEKQLARYLLFRHFVGLDIAEYVPDHSKFWRFRQKLNEGSLMNDLLDEINAQLSEQGLFIKSGGVSIIDASVIEAHQCRPNKNKDGQSTQDPEVGWNVKVGSDGKIKSTYDFKATEFTAGNVHDSNVFTQLLDIGLCR